MTTPSFGMSDADIAEAREKIAALDARIAEGNLSNRDKRDLPRQRDYFQDEIDWELKMRGSMDQGRVY